MHKHENYFGKKINWIFTLMFFFLFINSGLSQNKEKSANGLTNKAQIIYKSYTINNHGFYIPKDINECFIEIDKTLNKKSKELIKNLKPDEYKRIGRLLVIGEWDLEDTSRTTKLFFDLGLFETRYYYGIIGKCYYRYLNNIPIEFENEVTKAARYIDSCAIIGEKEYQERLKLDRIDGVYIPKNLEECFNCLDTLLDDATVTEIKNTPDSMMYLFHMGLGQWIRNNWGLWGGSRLLKYFFDIEVKHPDDMSGIILCSYNRYLKGLELDVAGQIAENKEWYENMKKQQANLPKLKKEDWYSDEYRKFLKKRKQDYKLSKEGDPDYYYLYY